jgi:beta-alanine degradation protein BauB
MAERRQRPAARPTVQVDDARVQVTEWCFAPGAATGWHRHGYDYVVVPMTTGALILEAAAGTSRSELVVGRA